MNEMVAERRLVHPLATLKPESETGYWYGSLELGFECIRQRTRLVQRRHRGPLCVHRPFYPEGDDLAHIYILHPPGGLVSGDSLRISADLKANTQALFTTPGAGRVYRARTGNYLQEQVNVLKVGEGASCEWFPQENIIFPGANTHLETRVSLAADSTFLGWEITVLGLPSNGIDFRQGAVRQRFLLERDGRPLLLENFRLNERSQALYHGKAGMQSCPVSGVFIAGPCGEGKDLAGKEMARVLQALREVRLVSRDQPANWAVTRNGEFIVVRYLGGDAEQARELFTRMWELLRPVLLDRAACKPRIWAT